MHDQICIFTHLWATTTHTLAHLGVRAVIMHENKCVKIFMRFCFHLIPLRVKSVLYLLLLYISLLLPKLCRANEDSLLAVVRADSFLCCKSFSPRLMCLINSTIITLQQPAHLRSHTFRRSNGLQLCRCCCYCCHGPSRLVSTM